MKRFKFFILCATFISAALCGKNVEQLISDLSSEDYELRYKSLLELKAEVGAVTVPGIEQLNRNEYESVLLEAAQDQGVPDLSRVYVIRLLALIAQDRSLEQLALLAVDSKTPALVRENVIQALSSNPSASSTNALLQGLMQADQDNLSYWWSAICYQVNDNVDEKLVKWLKKNDVDLSDQIILTLGQVGQEKVCDFLYAKWEKADQDQKLKLEQAIVNIANCSESHLVSIYESGSCVSTRVAALKLLVDNSPKKAEKLFSDMLKSNSNNRLVLIKAVLGSEKTVFWDKLMADLKSLNQNELKMVFRSIAENEMIEYENDVLQWVHDEDVGSSAILCLASIGGGASASVVIDSLKSTNEDIQSASLYTLSRLKDSELDRKMMALAAKTNDASHLLAIDVVSIRNSEGGVDLFNKMLYQGIDVDTEKAVLVGLENIGNVDSCKVLSSRIISETNKASRKRLQVTLKRLSMKLMINDTLWDQVYNPALNIAALSSQKTGLIEILDGISTDEALAYCLELLKSSDSEEVKKSVEGVFKRWRGLSIHRHWMSVLNSSQSTEKEKMAAIRLIGRLMKADYVIESQSQRASLAADLFLNNENEQLRKELLKAVDGFSNAWIKGVFVRKMKNALSVRKYESDIKALDLPKF